MLLQIIRISPSINHTGNSMEKGQPERTAESMEASEKGDPSFFLSKVQFDFLDEDSARFLFSPNLLTHPARKEEGPKTFLLNELACVYMP